MVSKILLVASISFLKSVSSESRLFLHGSGAGHSVPVDNVFDCTLSGEWALAGILTIARLHFLSCASKFLFSG